MADFAYAVHTDVCTYLLDDSGVCLWVLSPNPSTAKIVESCVGAQFVACSDTRVQGGLTSELVAGAAALFVRISKETGRPILLRTGPIQRVQTRNPGDNLPVNLPGLHVIADTDMAEPPTVKQPSTSPRALPKRKSETSRPPPLPKAAKRRIEPEEPSITLVTYPGGPMKPPVIVRGTELIAQVRPSAPSRASEEAAPLPLRNKRKK